MSDPFELPPLVNESNLKGESKAKRERELLKMSIKRAEARLKEMDKREKEQQDA
jgi:hypothetical protein